MRDFYRGKLGSKTGAVHVNETVCLFDGRNMWDATITAVGRVYFDVRAESRLGYSAFRFRLGCTEGNLNCDSHRYAFRIYDSRASCLDIVRRTEAWKKVTDMAFRFRDSTGLPTQEELKRLECGINEALSKELGT